MSQVEGDGTPGTKHDLLLRVGLVVNDNPGWLIGTTAGVLPGAAAVMSVVGQDRQDGGDWAFIGGAGVALLVSGLLQWLSSWAAKKASEADLFEVDRLRVTIKDALQPVAEMIADMEMLNRQDRVAMLKPIATQAVAGLHLIYSPNIGRIRATVYRLTPEGDMENVAYLGGRGEGVQPQPFLRQTLRGEEALAIVNDGRDLLVPDIDDVEKASDGKVVSADYRGSRSGYKTFVCCSITNGAKRYGMVTLDAPSPGDLVDTDKQLVGLMADLLAIAFAIAERGARPPKIGEGAGKGIE